MSSKDETQWLFYVVLFKPLGVISEIKLLLISLVIWQMHRWCSLWYHHQFSTSPRIFVLSITYLQGGDSPIGILSAHLVYIRAKWSNDNNCNGMYRCQVDNLDINLSGHFQSIWLVSPIYYVCSMFYVLISLWPLYTGPILLLCINLLYFNTTCFKPNFGRVLSFVINHV